MLVYKLTNLHCIIFIHVTDYIIIALMEDQCTVNLFRDEKYGINWSVVYIIPNNNVKYKHYC